MKKTWIGAAAVVAVIGAGLLYKDAGREVQFVLGGAMVNIGFRMQDHLESFDFEHHDDISPEDVWNEMVAQNEMASRVRQSFPRTPRHPLVAIVACMDARIDVPATDVDIVLGDEEISLAENGIPGRIIPTPGHSMGSVSVLLETGDAFVGDLAMNAFPLRLSPGLPIFAEDLQEVKKSWHLLLAKGAKTIYPAHGKPFPADAIRSALS